MNVQIYLQFIPISHPKNCAFALVELQGQHGACSGEGERGQRRALRCGAVSMDLQAACEVGMGRALCVNQVANQEANGPDGSGQ